MIIGIIGVGIVGGTLKTWFEENTTHNIRCYDPHKGMNDSLEDCAAIFISVPVKPDKYGQEQRLLSESVSLAKKYTDIVFVRSTVLPGTCDKLGCISMPEFLTERQAHADMNKYPVLVGQCDQKLLELIFPGKEFIIVTNIEAELAKFTHNCFGAMKVTYFNMIHNLCDKLGADFESVKMAASITGFIGPMHTQIPGPDGFFGYGGKCFPENMHALREFLHNMQLEQSFIKTIEDLNIKYRNRSYFEAANL